MTIMGKMKSEARSKGFYAESEGLQIAADPVVKYMDVNALRKAIENTRKSMEKSARQLDFIQAARFRDEMYELEKLLEQKK
jgi:excinuclease ABC subunit B